MRRSLGVGVSVVTTALLGAGVVVGAVASDAPPAASVDLGTGSAWFGNRRGSAVLIDGVTGRSITQVRGALGSEQSDVEQEGTSALVVDRAAGTVARVDGATWRAGEPRSVSSANDPGLKVLVGGGSAWAIGQATTVVQQLDTRELGVIGEPQTVPSRVSGAAVSRAGTLWVTSPDGEVRSYRDGRPQATHLVDGMRQASLVMAGDDPVVVDPAAHIARRLDPDSAEPVGEPLCFDAPAGSQPLVAGTTSARRWLLSVVPTTGTLYVVDTRVGNECRAFGLGEPATSPRYGDPVEKDGRVFVPDRQSGQVVVVEPDAPVPHAQKIRRLDVQLPDTRLRVLARGNRMWWENPDGDEVGVITDDLQIRRGTKGEPDGAPDGPGEPRDGSGDGKGRPTPGTDPGERENGRGPNDPPPRPDDPGTAPPPATPPGQGPAPTPPGVSPPPDPGTPPPPKGDEPISVTPPIELDRPPSPEKPGQTTTVPKSPVTTRPGQVTVTTRPTTIAPGGTTTTSSTTTTTRSTTTTTTLPPLVASISFMPAAPTQDDEVTVTDTSPGAHTRQWRLPGSNVPDSTAPSVRVRYVSPGPYTITLTIFEGGRQAVRSVPITVLARNQSTVLGAPTSPGSGATLDFGASVGVSADVFIGASPGGRIEVQPLSGGAPTPGVPPQLSAPQPAGNASFGTRFTVPGSGNPVRVDGIRVKVFMVGDNTLLAERTVGVNLVFAGPIPGNETCYSYNKSALAFLYMNGVPEPNGFLPVKQDEPLHALLAVGFPAQDILMAVAKGSNQYCYAGTEPFVYGGGFEFSYWKGPRLAPIAGENCRTYDPLRLRVFARLDGWGMTDDNGMTVDAGADAAAAQQALAVARRYTQSCTLVNDGNRTLEYWR